MANEAENAIYNRLASAPSFHPANADLLTRDWMLEPGDVVTVRSGEESYQVPIYSMNLEWRGDSKVSIESTGNQKREPLPALRRKQYGGGSAAYKEQKRFTADLQRVETDLGAKIGLVVAENDQGGNVIRSASIVAAINSSGSEVKISADHIILDGDTIAAAIYGKSIEVSTLSVASSASIDSLTVSNEADIVYVDAQFLDGTELIVDGQDAVWKSVSVVTSSNLSASHDYMYLEDGVQRVQRGRLASGTTTIYYLGHS